MSVARNAFCSVEYRTRWSMQMIPWYRQVISLVYGLGVILIALWALEQGTGPYVILGVVGMSMLTLMLIFGVEVSEVRILDKLHITFTETGDTSKSNEQDATDDDESEQVSLLQNGEDK